MDGLSQHTRKRWNELAGEGVMSSQPWLELGKEGARRAVVAGSG